MENIGYIDASGAGFSGMQMTGGRVDPGKMRPYVKRDNRGNALGTYLTCYSGSGDAEDIRNYREVQINSGFHVNETTLRREEWKQLDAAVLPEAQTRLGGINDLIKNGLVYNLGNAMGTTVLEWHTQAGEMTALLTMDGVTRGENNRPVYETHYLPIPILHVDYEISARTLALSRNMGNPLDTTDAAMARRAIDLKLEQMLFTNVDYTYGGTTTKIYSYLNYPDKSNVVLHTNWDASGKTGAQILADVQEMIAASIADLHYGPWNLYIPTLYQAVLDNDYSTQYPNVTIRDRIMKLAGIKDIVTVDTLTANNVLLVQMTPDVVRLVQGMGIQNVQWGVEGNMITKFKVMTIQVPQIRSDHNNKTGIVHLAGSF